MEWIISNIQKEANDAITYTLKSLGNASFAYLPGQFLTFLFEFEGREVRRSYSFSSAPGVDEWPMITVKRVPNGEISRYIQDFWRVGLHVKSIEPAGRFVWNPTQTPADIFLLAAGSGITPIYSLMKQILTANEGSMVHLFYSNQNAQGCIFFDQLNHWQENYSKNLLLTYFFSESKYLDKARLTKSNLPEIVASERKYPLEKALFYICGPHEYMQMATITLLSMGIGQDQIRKEIFVTNDIPTPKWEMADKRTKSIKVDFAGTKYTFQVPYNKSILDVALENGVALPYSCRSGKCSACAAKCIQGEVVMSYNEVLTPKDEKEGLVLMCTGHPVTNDVLITYLR